MVTKYKLPLLFGLAHGVNDFIAGYLLSYLSTHSTNWKQNSIAFLLYSIIAFGGQLPAGIIVDKSKNIKTFSVVSLCIMLVSVLLFYQNIFFAILMSSIASAFIHVCGGAVCYSIDNKSATLSGIFTAPGVLGLILGSLLGVNSFINLYWIAMLLILLVVFIFINKMPVYDKDPNNTVASVMDTHDFIMLILFFAIAFRSLLWNIIHLFCLDNKDWLLGIGIAAFIGKLAGGYIYDKFDGKKFVMISVLFSIIFLYFGKQHLWMLCIGVALLQSAVPITLLLTQQYLKNQPATGAGIALGLAIVLAGLPTYFQQFRNIEHQYVVLVIVSSIFIVTNYLAIKKLKL